MNIVELRNRLTAIIDENEKRGWSNRNSSDVVLKMKVTKRKNEWRKVAYVSSAWVGFPNGKNVFEIQSEDFTWHRG